MPAGQPPIYENADKMEGKIYEYFQQFEAKEIRAELGELRPTITGLVIFLGFCSRQSFYDYEKKPEFSYTVKSARARIENIYEQMLSSKYSTGAIFALKNFDWSDKQEIEHSSSIEKPFILQIKPDKP